MSTQSTHADGSFGTASAAAGSRRQGRSRRRLAVWIVAGVVVLAAAAGGIVWALTGNSKPTANAPHVSPITPVALSAGGLKTLARAVGQPIYWAGPKAGFQYELSRVTNGNVYIRYLPESVDAGAAGTSYVIVATYPFAGAYAALQKLAAGQGFSVQGGGLALVDSAKPQSIHLAYPNLNYQVEVYAPTAAQALALVKSGHVTPVR